MSAALALSFIFSWIFLLISLTALLFGSHTERYICQGLERNSNGTIELLEVIDEVLEIRRPDLMQIEGQTAGLRNRANDNYGLKTSETGDLSIVRA